MGGCLGSGANTNLCKYHSPTLVGAPFLGLQAVFSQEEHSLVKTDGHVLVVNCARILVHVPSPNLIYALTIYN